MRLVLTITLSLYASIALSQSVLTQDFNDLINPNHLMPALFNKDSSATICYDALYGGLAWDASYFKDDVKLDSLKGSGWFDKLDSLDASVWLNNSFYVKRIQLNLKFPVHFGADSSQRDDSLGHKVTVTFHPKLQLGWYPRFHGKMDGDIRFQLSWTPRVKEIDVTQDELEINCVGKIPHFGVHQLFLRRELSDNTWIYGVSGYLSFIPFPKSNFFRGFDFDYSYNRVLLSENKHSDNFDIGVVSEFFFGSEESTIYAFVYNAHDFNLDINLVHFGILWQFPVSTHIFPK